ncbi:3'-5' exonuclease DinG [Streptomyces tanashiensis]
MEALHPLLRRRPEFAMLKGRSNYLCLHRLHEGVPQDEEEGLFDQFEAAAPTSKLGQDLLRMRDWSDETETGDRDDLTPGVSDRAWAAGVGVLAGVPGRDEVRVRRGVLRRGGPRARQAADVIVTNHALLAIDAIEGAPVLPQHEVLIVDEAHELVSRVTGVATGELTPGQVNRAVRRAAKLVNEKAADQLQTAAEGFERLMELALPGRLEEIPEDLGYALHGAAGRVPDGDLGDRRHPRQVRSRTRTRCASRRWPRWRACTTWRSGSRTVPSGTSSGTSGMTGSVPRCGSRRCRSPGCCGRSCSPTARWC